MVKGWEGVGGQRAEEEEEEEDGLWSTQSDVLPLFGPLITASPRPPPPTAAAAAAVRAANHNPSSVGQRKESTAPSSSPALRKQVISVPACGSARAHKPSR